MALIGPMSGSLTRLESGSPAWVSGNGLSITSGSDGSVTFTAVQQINLANFGDKSDGDVTLVTGGAGAPAWTTYSSDIYTMTRDAFLNNLTVNSGVSLRPDGFLPYIAGTLVNSGTIERRGADASGVTGGAAVTDKGTFLADSTGGGTGAASTGNTTGGNSTLLANSAGGTGGAGGTANTTVLAGVPGTASAPIASITSWRTLNYVLSQRLISATTILGLNGGTGGSGGGASGNGVGQTATSGGGGAGAINLFLIMNTLDNAGTIRSRGGNGANASVVGTAFGAGGGGGGGAGSVLIAANKVLALGTISSTGGNGGTGAGISGAASAGGVGPVIILSGSL